MSAPRGAVSTSTSSVRPNLVPQEVVRQLMVGDVEVFRTFVLSMHNAMSDHVESRGLRMTVTEDELFTYFLSAVRTRCYRASRKYEAHDPAFHLRCNSAWALPAMFAAIVDKIGVVELTVPRAVFVPVWNTALNELTFTQPAQLVQITGKLRSLADHPDLKMAFVSAIQNNETGDQEVMTLIPLRDELGRIREIRGKVPFDGVSAAIVYALHMVHGFYEAVEASMLERVCTLENPYRLYAEEVQEALLNVAWRVA
jgi:hypothetical protein